MTGDGGHVPFQAHVELLQSFLVRRGEVVERIQGVLSARRKPLRYLTDRAFLARQIEDSFFAPTAAGVDQAHLRGELQKAHRASGFVPREVQGLHNDIVDPAEMAIRGFHCWRQTRWPGRNGRVRYAHTVFDLYLLRQLELLSMRLWDAGPGNAGERLAQVQGLLDSLAAGAPSDQPVLVRDARWLIPLAQSPTTDELAAYLGVAQQVAESLAGEDRLEILKAHVLMIGGHLRSQIRHYCMQEDMSLDDESVVLRTRTSNALDFALLIQGLVPMLEAYDSARQGGDDQRRLVLAGAICQGISPDPEVFVNRLDLLAPYSMMEHLFVATDPDGNVACTPTGRRHLELFSRYEALIGRLSAPLHEDCSQFKPVEGAYSPYGAIFGTPTNLVEDMALKTLQPDAVTQFSLEDVFAETQGDGERLAWVSGWRQLPHVGPEVQRLYGYPQQFAEAIFDRIERAFGSSVSDGKASDVGRTGRLWVLPGDRQADSSTAAIANLPVEYVGSSDVQIVAAQKAVAYDEARLLRDRQEGYFAVSYETSGGWVAVRKDFLTAVLGAGRDAKIVGVPDEAAAVLSLMCPGLVKRQSASGQASMPASMSKA